LTFMLLCMLSVGGVIYLVKKAAHQRPAPATVEPGVVADGQPPPPNPPTAPAPVASLDSYKYPRAKIIRSNKQGSNQEIEMTTDDSVEKVRDFYQEKFKNSPINFNNEDGERYVFTTLGQPVIVITVQPDEEHNGKTQIILVSAGIPFLKFPFSR